ncbi:hypothetical protein ACVP8M_18505 (plasmid) [Acinetobacter baumannii]
MIKLEGVVINTFKIEAGKNKKGEEYEAADKVQLLGSLELPNGQIKNELIDLKVEDSSCTNLSKTNLLALVVVHFPQGKMLFFMSEKVQNLY